MVYYGELRRLWLAVSAHPGRSANIRIYFLESWISAMRFDHSSIAKIFVGPEEHSSFRGTGFLVTPVHVVTCGHVLFAGYGQNQARQKPEVHSAQIADLKLRFGRDSDGAVQRYGTLVRCSLPDLAVIRLDTPVESQPAPLVSGLTSEYETALSDLHGSVIGFSQTEDGRLIERPIQGSVSLAWDFHTQQLLSIQISGGLSPGMSGSPLIVRIGDQTFCFGMAHLGGDGTAIARMILSNTIVSFLNGLDIVPPLVIHAGDCIPKGMAADLSHAASLLKAALDRLLANDSSGHDRKLLQQSLLNGSLVFSSGNQNAAPQGNSGIIISGNKYRVVVHIDEENSAALGERLFPPAAGVAPPPPPVFFLGRNQDLITVKSLLQPDAAEAPGIVVVEGWPGVGKSSFASVLGRDLTLKAYFPDGVLWTALGQHPNLFSSLGAWARSLGIEDILRMPTLTDAVTRIRKALLSRAMLLIVDDAWNLDDVTPFLMLSTEKSRLLITTRRPAIAQELTTVPVIQYRLPVLDEGDAFKLLWNLAPNVVQENQDTCRVLLRDLEYLPLAIHVAGRLLRSEAKLGWSVAELLEEIRSGAKIIREKAPEDRAEEGRIPTVSALLARSTDLLDEETREYFAYLGAFAPKPATFDLDAIAAVWQEKDPKPHVRKLVGHGLLEPARNGRFQMHALLVAHACSLLPD